ncbi:MFS transporter [Vibrio alfacsensis]|uniref:MFS transporter n=1 Tax=Vibrio alfacsensis TaxID=1074311 RepID=UPI001BEF045F|nr:MFS transporter [Vibrio alfacsensis]BCN24909.1 MFS transporter [Vibrio alfacsensis]
MKHKKETQDSYWKVLVLILCFGWVAIWIYRTVLTPIYPEIQAAFGGISDTEIGLISTFYFSAYCGGQIPASLCVERKGQKFTLLVGFSLFSFGTLVIANANSMVLVYGGSLFSGLGCASFFCSAYSLSGQNVPEKRRALASAVVNSGCALGMGIGLIGSSVLVRNMGMPWYDVLYVSAAIIIIMAIVFALMIKNGKTTKHEPRQAITPNENANKEKKSLFSSQLIAAYFVYFCTCYGYYMIVTWLPSFLQSERGFEGAAIGGASALVAVAAVPGAIFFSSFVDKYRHQAVRTVILLEIAAAIMLTCAVIAPNTWALMLCLVIYGFLGKMALDPILIAFVTERVPTARLARALAIFNLSGMSSSIIAPPITGFISDVTGSKAIGFYLSSGLLIIGAITFTFICLRRYSHLERQQA